MEIAEEEALFHRMLMEAQRIEEAKHQQMSVQDSVQDGRTAAQSQNNLEPRLIVIKDSVLIVE